MLLKKGSNGEDVKKLQTKLGLASDGIFGAMTETAVKKWQTSNNLPSTGIVDDNTWNKMFNNIVKTESKVSPTTSMDISKLKGHVPDTVLNEIPSVMDKFKINTPLRLSHFLAQCGHESGNFKSIRENLNYSKERLKQIFPKYFPGNLSESYDRNPEKIASKVYGNRMGNGDEFTKEGYIFRGRGYIQLTGKDNYKSFGQAINENLLTDPDLVATKYPLLSAAWFFSKNKINEIADKGSSDDVVKQVTKKVNGGHIGIEDRIEHFKKFLKLLSN